MLRGLLALGRLRLRGWRREAKDKVKAEVKVKSWGLRVEDSRRCLIPFHGYPISPADCAQEQRNPPKMEKLPKWIGDESFKRGER
jgi:hypothetical protein